MPRGIALRRGGIGLFVCRRQRPMSIHLVERRASQPAAITALADEIGRAIGVIRSLSDDVYRSGPDGRRGVGEQFRHNLDFVTCLLNGLELGRINYTDRERDALVETDRGHAIERFANVSTRLQAVAPRILARSVLVRSEIDLSVWLPSSIGREIEFVHSHTVHHHALIAEKLAASGVETGRDFGVAPSTLKYWNAAA